MANISISVNRKIELVQIIIYLAKRQNKTFQHLNNKEYFSAIQAYFQKFEGHKAVKITAGLIDNGNFIHIKPLKAVLTMDETAENPGHPLYKWSLAVKSFEAETDSNEFFRQNYNYFSALENEVKSYGVKDWVSYTERFFKKSYNDFNLIICPSTGNYGFIMNISQKDTAYMVDTVYYYDDCGNRHGGEANMAYGTAHEFGHCFVNPVVESHLDKLNGLSAFFRSHTNMLNAYNVDYAVMNEYFVRAYAVKFMVNHKNDFPDFNIEEVIGRHKKTFIYIEEFIKYLDEYQCGNLSFEEFYLSKLQDISMLCTY